MPVRQPAILPYSVRFAQALGVLCTEEPPLAMCVAWLNSDDDALQAWVQPRMRNKWAAGIGVIDAAHTLAEQTEEGRPELVTYEQELVIERLKGQDIAIARRPCSGWFATDLPAGLSQNGIRGLIAAGLAVVHPASGNAAFLRLCRAYDFR